MMQIMRDGWQVDDAEYAVPERLSWTGMARVLPDPGMSREAQERLGASLRAMYDDLLAEALPEHLTRFLDERLSRGSLG